MAPTDHQRQQVKTHARTHFEKWALSYDRSRLNEFVFFPSVRRCQEEIIRWKANRPAAPFRALDIGCGTGTLLSLLEADPDAEALVGLDYADGMARRAHDKFAAANEPHRMLAVRGDAERLPFAHAAFDVVTCCNSFHHYPHQERAVAEFYRVLRPGGMLILIDGFRDNVIGWAIFDVCVATIEKHVHHASWSRVRALLIDAGFPEITQSKMNVLAPLLVSRAIKR